MIKGILFTLLGFATIEVLEAHTLLVAHHQTMVAIVSKDSSLQAYCGTYLLEGNPYIDEISLSLKNGQLISITPENEEVVLEPTDAEDTFFIAMIKAKVVFTRENGVVVGIRAKVNGMVMEGVKK
jgi:hypothetical protein